MIALTPHQQTAVHWCLDRIQSGAPLIALRGLAGVGKSSLIPHLRRLLQAHGHETVVGTPTNRAAMVVRQKGEKDAATFHALCLVPYFDEPYTAAKTWLEAYPGVEVAREALPALLQDALTENTTTTILSGFLLPLRATCLRYGPDKALRTVGILAEEHFAGFGPRGPQSAVLLLDEASMVGAESLAKVQEVYRQIILIGDPGQLPPVGEQAVLEETLGTELTEIHRQADTSPLIHLAHHIRQGGLIDRAKLMEYAPAVSWVTHLDAESCRIAPLLVWRNATRITCTLRIRACLGYTPETLAIGEPLVCRVNARKPYARRVAGKLWTATTPESALSMQPFCNNACYHIIDTHGPREVTLQDDLTGDTYPHVQVHMEESDGEREAPESTRFRWGYVGTCHVFQGGEWGRIAISVPELRAMNDMARAGRLSQDALIAWRYTAITRARKEVIFLAEHCFT